jgi:hypothetical protein
LSAQRTKPTATQTNDVANSRIKQQTTWQHNSNSNQTTKEQQRNRAPNQPTANSKSKQQLTANSKR